MTEKDLKILLIGPKLSLEKNNLGGATQSFEYLIHYFSENNISCQLVDTQEYKGVLSLLYVLIKYVKLVWKCNLVFLNVSQNGIKFMAPLIFILSKAFNKKVVIRPFGGAFIDQYKNASSTGKWMFRKTVLKADILYLQTEILINFFKQIAKNLIQFKTSRPTPKTDLLRSERFFEKRFLFVSQLKKTKGLDELIELINMLDQSYTLDLYGTIEEEKYKYLEKSKAPFYKGVLKGGNEVLSTIRNYDVIVLPTFYEGEGYPGILIEAYSLGIPVITTKWKAIPEIVEDGKTGFLIEPRSTEELRIAIHKFNNDNYREMSENSLNYYRANFQLDSIMRKLVDELKSIF